MSDPLEQCDGGSDLLTRLPAEHQLSLLRALVDGSMDAIIVHEADGTAVFYSQGLCRLLGLSDTEMHSLEPFGWVTRESIRGAPDRLEAILHGGKLNFRSTIKRHDGVTVPTEVFAQRLDTDLGPLVVATIRDVSEQIDAEERLHYLAYRDALTGLASRVAFTERLGHAIADAKRHGDLILVAYFDIDHFRALNEAYGHGAGDEVLTETGRRLEAAIRDQDMVARLGGDEFAVLLCRPTSVEEIPSIAQRLLDAIRAPLVVGDIRCGIDASIGFSVFDPDRDDERSLLVKADIAMYVAKSDPAHTWLAYDDSMS